MYKPKFDSYIHSLPSLIDISTICSQRQRHPMRPVSILRPLPTVLIFCSRLFHHLSRSLSLFLFSSFLYSLCPSLSSFSVLQMHVGLGWWVSGVFAVLAVLSGQRWQRSAKVKIFGARHGPTWPGESHSIQHPPVPTLDHGTLQLLR